MMHASNSFRRLTTLFVLMLLSTLLLCVPFIVGAQEENLTNNGLSFTSISGIPGLDSGTEPDTGEFLRNIYRMAIIIAAIIAVIKLILAGVQYTLSGVITKKENAKRDIRSALVGLLIILAAITLLTQINPDITNLPALQDLPSDVRLSGVPQSSAQQVQNYCSGLSTGDCVTNRTCGAWMSIIDPVVNSGSNAINANCQRICESINGLFVDYGCTYSQSRLVDTVGQRLLDDYCPAGETCTVEDCEARSVATYGGDRGVSGSGLCVFPEIRTVTVSCAMEGGETYHEALNRCARECEGSFNGIGQGAVQSDNIVATCSTQE